MTKVLMISTDRKAFVVGSAVRSRLAALGDLVDRLTVIVLTKKSHGFRPVQISDKVFLQPTNSRTRLSHLWQACRLGARLLKADRTAIGNYLITCQDPFETGLVGWWLARRFKIKLELQIHTDFLAPDFYRLTWLNRIRVGLASFLLPRANQIRVVSERIKNSLLASRWRLKTEPFVLPIFIDREAFLAAPITVDLHQAYPQFDKIILMVARFSPEKRLALAIQAFAELSLTQPTAGLVIVGAGPLLTDLRRLVNKLQVEEKVIFTGWVANPAGLYRTADVFLLTSAYEGYSLSLIEAALAELPIVATDAGVAPAVGADIVAAQPVAIAQALIATFSHGRRSPPKNLPIVSKIDYFATLKKAWRGAEV